MNRKMNIGEMQMWQKAENLIEEIYKQISDVGSYHFNCHFRRVVLAILGNLTASRQAGSPVQYCAFLTEAESACNEIRHMLRTARYYRYIHNSVADELDEECRELALRIQGVIRNAENRFPTPAEKVKVRKKRPKNSNNF